jgi:hypothetical protein
MFKIKKIYQNILYCIVTIIFNIIFNIMMVYDIQILYNNK